MWYSAQVRACSLTCCRPRGRDFPGPATGNRRRDVRGAAQTGSSWRSGSAISKAMERLGRRNSIANDQFSMTNSQSTLAGSDAFRNGLARKFSTKSHQIAPNRTKKNLCMAKKSQFGALGTPSQPLCHHPNGGPGATLHSALCALHSLCRHPNGGTRGHHRCQAPTQAAPLPSPTNELG